MDRVIAAQPQMFRMLSCAAAELLIHADRD